MVDSNGSEIDFQPSKEDTAFLDQQLEDFNAVQTGRNDANSVEMVIRDPEGRVIAGLKGLTVLDWLYVGTLWVHQDHRDRGLGSRVLLAAEDIARRRGCIGACLTSFSFQAPDFYRRHGYASFASIEDYPIGQELIFFKKRLDN